MMKRSKIKSLKKKVIILFNSLAFFSAAYFCITHISLPQSSLGRTIFSGVISACSLSATFSIIITSLRSPARLISVMASGILLSLIIILVAGVFLDRAIANPVSAITYVIPIICFGFVYRLSTQSLRYESSHMTETTGTVGSLSYMQLKPEYRKVSDKDRNTIAAHEAGHALVYAALGNLPDDFHVCIKDKIDATNSLGYVSGLSVKNSLSYKTESEWFMLVLLAGKKGELSTNEPESLGATGDMQKWLELASQYLSNQYRGIYYPYPSSKTELESNKEQLQIFKEEQAQLLNQFFTLNRSVHQELKIALLDKGKLTRHELIPYLKKVVFPDNFPLLPHFVEE